MKQERWSHGFLIARSDWRSDMTFEEAHQAYLAGLREDAVQHDVRFNAVFGKPVALAQLRRNNSGRFWLALYLGVLAVGGLLFAVL